MCRSEAGWLAGHASESRLWRGRNSSLANTLVWPTRSLDLRRYVSRVFARLPFKNVLLFLLKISAVNAGYCNKLQEEFSVLNRHVSLSQPSVLRSVNWISVLCCQMDWQEGNVLMTELILTSSCVFWRVDVIFFCCCTFQTVVLWQYCHVFHSRRFVSAIFFHVLFLSVTTKLYCTTRSMLEQKKTPNHYIFYFIAPKISMKVCLHRRFLVFVLHIFYPAWRIHTILLRVFKF